MKTQQMVIFYNNLHNLYKKRSKTKLKHTYYLKRFQFTYYALLL